MSLGLTNQDITNRFNIIEDYSREAIMWTKMGFHNLYGIYMASHNLVRLMKGCYPESSSMFDSPLPKNPTSKDMAVSFDFEGKTKEFGWNTEQIRSIVENTLNDLKESKIFTFGDPTSFSVGPLPNSVFFARGVELALEAYIDIIPENPDCKKLMTLASICQRARYEDTASIRRPWFPLPVEL